MFYLLMHYIVCTTYSLVLMSKLLSEEYANYQYLIRPGYSVVRMDTLVPTSGGSSAGWTAAAGQRPGGCTRSPSPTTTWSCRRCGSGTAPGTSSCAGQSGVAASGADRRRRERGRPATRRARRGSRASEAWWAGPGDLTGVRAAYKIYFVFAEC